MTINDAKKNPALFLYLWADESRFLQKIDPKSAAIIRQKKANQAKLLLAIAKGNQSRYKEYAQTIYDCIKAMYGMSAESILVKLANGETVAGKNWNTGVYGDPAPTGTFKQKNGTVTVDPNTGAILYKGADVTDKDFDIVTDDVISNRSGFVDDAQFISYRGSDGKYYAYMYTSQMGAQYTATGKLLQAANSDAILAKSNIWLDIIGQWKLLIERILGLFGVDLSKIFDKSEKITAENTAPNQIGDGFTYTPTPTPIPNKKTGIDAGTLAIVGAGAALLLLNRKSKKKSE